MPRKRIPSWPSWNRPTAISRGTCLTRSFNASPRKSATFLLRSSVLDSFSAPLCDAALGIDSSRSLIAEIERGNLFMLPLDDRQEWFRYHHKFSELLYERMKRTEPAQINMIYRGASGWFEQQGMTDHAIDYAIRARTTSPRPG